MRDIKFRAWDVAMQRMTGIITPLDTDFVYGGWNNVEWMQFTGLKDKNGKEIYEGDIVRVGFYPINELPVRWNEAKAGWFPFLHDRKPKSYEVIGNIYENPELISKER